MDYKLINLLIKVLPQSLRIQSGSLNSIYFPFFPFIILLSVSVHMLWVCNSDVENVCLTCCGSTSLIYTVILYKWNRFSSFYSLRTSVQKYHAAAISSNSFTVHPSYLQKSIPALIQCNQSLWRINLQLMLHSFKLIHVRNNSMEP